MPPRCACGHGVSFCILVHFCVVTVVLRLVLGEDVKLAAIGTAVGLLAALGLARTIATMLYGVTPSDPAVYAGAAAVAVMVAIAASAIPARQAARVDPATALRRD